MFMAIITNKSRYIYKNNKLQGFFIYVKIKCIFTERMI